MRRWLIVLMMVSLFVGLSSARAVQAQSAIEFDSIQVDLWPEYDRPEVLVIYRMTLSGTTSLPAQISMRIPAAAGQPYNVANQDVDGMLYLLDYDLVLEGDWLRVSFTTPTPTLQIEFYDAGIRKDGNLRNYDFKWAADYQVNTLTVKVQKPFNATDFNLMPQMGSAQQEGNGLFYYTTIVGTVDVATPVSLSFSYNKPDDQLSVNLMPVQASTPVEAPGTQVDWSAILPWILGGVGLLVIAFGAFWFWKTGRKSASPGGSRRHRPASPETRPQTNGDGGTVFCHACGKRAGPGDAFCRACGSRLRVE
jgi:hypothetical protein